MTTITAPEVRRSVGDRVPDLLARLLGVRAGEATWVAPAMLGVVGLATVLYLFNLTISGYANTYYSAAALAGSQSWSAWFFGSLDSANFITVDKPPLGTMLIGLSVRLFGLSSWSILLPEAVAGIGTVIVLMATVRRTFGPAAAVIAGLVSALTPAAVLIFRYNNPDALLTLLLVGSAYVFVRSLERGSLRWVATAAILVGFGFLTKYLQAWFVLPAFALTWLIAAPGTLGRRMVGLAVAFVAVIAASGWWVAVMELIPAANRAYIGGSTTNSVIQLLLGYDGLGRIFGQGAGGFGGGGGGGGGFSGTPGLLRLFNAQLGGQVGWLLPLALVSIGIGLVVRRRFARTDAKRAAYLMWGLWLAVHVVVFSFMSGIIHSYYAVAMAPAIGALVGGGVVELWRFRERVRWGGVALAAAVTGSAILAWRLLERTPTFAPGLGIAVIALSVPVAVILVGPARSIGRRPALLAAGLGLVLMLAGPAAYAADTVQTAYAGGDPSAGPTATDASGRAGFGGGGPAGGFTGGPNGTNGTDGNFAGGGGNGGGLAGTPGGGQVDSALVDYLVANRGNATWIVAVNGANEAGSIELASGLPVMAMGGFSGSDPAPTLAQLQAYAASGQLRYILIGDGRGGPGGASSEISSWVTANGTVVAAVGNGTLYDLSGAVSTAS
ncbi:MAG TPA: glycosyltransferase family 39 protein [Methylomirabilota bacterium]|nr:glycosyltransferase family 39 protein [Methylomirabilota bacterium]